MIWTGLPGGKRRHSSQSLQISRCVLKTPLFGRHWEACGVLLRALYARLADLSIWK